MKALVKDQAAPGLCLKEVAPPKIEDHEVLVKIHKTGICGTDIHIYNWDEWAQATIPVPLVIGHEFYGTVAELGKKVTNLSVGDRVSGEAHLTCGICRNCRAGKRHLCPETKGIGVHMPGAFAEFLKLPAENIYKISDQITDKVAAILDPLGNAIHTALSFNLICEDVLITGAGPIGLMAIAIAKRVGARNIVITDTNEYRLELAKKLGATLTVNIKHETISDSIKKLNMVGGFDVGLEMSGNLHALQAQINSLYPGGKIAILGIPPKDEAQSPINWHQVIFKELTLKGIYGREMFETWYQMVNLLQNGLNIDPVITHEYAAEDFEQAFTVAQSGKAGKIILSW